MSAHDEDFDAGYRVSRQELEPLTDVITETVALLRSVDGIGSMTPTQRHRVMDRCLPMANQLERLVRAYRLNGTKPNTSS